MLKYDFDICVPILMEIFNSCVRNGKFSDELDFADISPFSKSIDSTDRKNYRPISALRSVLKLCEI